ncbi:PucR family transcriptional regulator [Streptosporangium roseum]|uniref:PucR family transcriptional regulator n=1 Tax=Streptosporangium roseum TaxID=2001 RepID=UPI0004CD6E1E|nr:helix-turn-helix domain-containing protein [Streptosporangium roseum]
MASELQQLVDSLGSRLGRSVAIDDPNIRLLAYNSHTGDVDSVRMQSIMQRSVSPELVGYIHDSGALRAHDLFTVPARLDLGLGIARVCVPVRYEQVLLGFLWLLLSDGPVTDEQASAVRQAADSAARILHRDFLLGELIQGRERELVRDLISADAGLRGEAAQRLIEEDLAVAGPVRVLVATVAHEAGQPLGEQDRLALAVGLEQARRRIPPRSAIHLERPDHGILVLVQQVPSTSEVDDLAAAVQRLIVKESGKECWIGVGERGAGLSAAHESYGEAKQAADVARVIRILGPVVWYSGLGVYGLLAELPAERLGHSLHPGVRRLLDHDGGNDTLVSTLETFLDNAGDVKRTAAELCIHRASLYYRLRRVEEIARVRLSSGDDRLALHLGLKMARLIELR